MSGVEVNLAAATLALAAAEVVPPMCRTAAAAFIPDQILKRGDKSLSHGLDTVIKEFEYISANDMKDLDENHNELVFRRQFIRERVVTRLGSWKQLVKIRRWTNDASLWEGKIAESSTKGKKAAMSAKARSATVSHDDLATDDTSSSSGDPADALADYTSVVTEADIADLTASSMTEEQSTTQSQVSCRNPFHDSHDISEDTKAKDGVELDNVLTPARSKP